VSKTIVQLIAEANLRLKAARTGLIIELRYTSKLSLREQLPPQPGSAKLEKYSQRLPLKYLGNPAGIALAEADALNIASQLIKEKFNWADWIEVWTPETAPIADLLDRHKAQYLIKNSETSYHNYYLACYKWLPIDEPLTIKAIAPLLTRHAWAIRNITYGILDTISAGAMGHNVEVHTKIYQRWLGERDMDAVCSSALYQLL